MSTNYYAHGPGITDPERLHIGQSAAGWRFLFRAWPERGLTTAAAWNAFLHQEVTRIEDEFGVEYTPDDMNEIATQRLTDNEDRPLLPRYPNGSRRPGESIDGDGHAFYDGYFC